MEPNQARTMENSGYNSLLAGGAQGTTPSWNSGTGVASISRPQSSTMSNSGRLSQPRISINFNYLIDILDKILREKKFRENFAAGYPGTVLALRTPPGFGKKSSNYLSRMLA